MTTAESFNADLDQLEAPIGVSFGKAAARARAAKGWIHRDVAKRIGCGTREYIRIENGALPDTLTLVRIVDLLDMSADEALGISGPLTFEALRRANQRRLPRFPNAKGESIDHDEWTVADWMMATTGELGELANLCKKARRGDVDLSENRDWVASEVADVAIYLDLLAAELDVDLGHAIQCKFNATSQRIGVKVFLCGDRVTDNEDAS